MDAFLDTSGRCAGLAAAAISNEDRVEDKQRHDAEDGADDPVPDLFLLDQIVPLRLLGSYRTAIISSLLYDSSVVKVPPYRSPSTL
jgi:hypothetical protein